MVHLSLELIQLTFQTKGRDREGCYSGSLLDGTKLTVLRQVYKGRVIIPTKH